MRRRLEGVFHVLVRIIFTVLELFTDKHLIIFESFHGHQYSDNPRAIYEYINANMPEYQCVWAVKTGYEQPFIDNGVPYIKRLGVKWLLTMPRARYWVFNTRMPDWMIKGKNNVFLETWHGTPLKKLGLDIPDVKIPGTDTDKYRREFIAETSRWNYLISPNHFSSQAFMSAFQVKPEQIIETGYPRNDYIMQNGNNAKLVSGLKKSLGITNTQQVLLYAPTWRDDDFQKQGKYNFENHFPFDAVLRDNPNMIILTRLHYLVADTFDASVYGERVKDVSNYPDIKELYLIADLLVTDYSSVMFDYSVLQRPVILYMYDYEKYREQLRGFYFDPAKKFSKAVCYTTEELTNKINNHEYAPLDLGTDMRETNANSAKSVVKLVFNK